jgi:hypothetical protein
MANSETSESIDTAAKSALLEMKTKELNLRLRELDIQNKEYEAGHRPSTFRITLTNPAVIAAAIAAWASLTAAGLTWLSGQISASTQREAAVQQAYLDRTKFQANLILDSVRTNDPDKAAINLQFLIDSGLLTGDIANKLESYLKNRRPGEGQALPPR